MERGFTRMDIFFQDPNEIPLPPSEVRILEFNATPYPDKKRVRIYLELTPFQQRPSLDVNTVNSEGLQVSQISIIETMSRKLEFTIHLRDLNPLGKYLISAQVFYNFSETVEVENTEITSNQPTMMVDQMQATFIIDP